VAYGWQEFITLQETDDYKEMNATYGSFLDYYLTKLREQEKKEGKRLLHLLDLHWYPEAQGNGMRVTENDIAPDSIDARVQAPRSLWDPDYVEKSWITQWSTHNKPIRLIPWVKEKIDKDYPGTKLSFSEYDYGGGNHVSGGIAQADVLGIFGKYGVFMSNYWGDLNPYNQAAFKLYRNYDGNNGTFGSTSISADTGDISLASIYAATDPAQPRTLWLMVLNKSQKALLHGLFNLQGKRAYKSYVSYGFDGKSADIQKLKEGMIDGNHFNYSLTPLSATLFVCRGDNPVQK
jgi:mannan endo-1,4-beta-mannosidase